MMEYKQLTLSDLTLPDEEIYLTMGYRNHIPDEYIMQLVTDVLAEVATTCIPRYMFRVLEAACSGNKEIQIDHTTFRVGKIISSYLPGMNHTCMFVTTAGKEYEAYLHHLKTTGDIVKEFVADAIGSVIAEACVSQISKELAKCEGIKQSYPYSPGYCGWNIKEQKELFSLFPEKPCGISLSESYLMSPVKSISGFIALGKELIPQPYRCEICANKHCYKRKERTNDTYERMGTTSH